MNSPSGKIERRFANFTSAEWVAALTPLYGADGAMSFAQTLFNAIEEKGSNGYSLPMQFWALLGRLGPSADARVAEMTREFPEECLREIASIRTAFDSEDR